MTVDLGCQREPSCGQCSERMLGRRRGVANAARTKTRTAVNQLPIRQGLEYLAEFAGCIHDQRLQRNDGRALALTAVSRATLICLTISAAPSADLGTAVASPASTDRAAVSASRVSLLP